MIWQLFAVGILAGNIGFMLGAFWAGCERMNDE